MASDLLSRLDAMGRAEHDDLSVAAEAAEEIRRLRQGLAVVRECAAREAEAVATTYRTRWEEVDDKALIKFWHGRAAGAESAAKAIRKLDLDGQGAAMMRERGKLLAERHAGWRAGMEEAAKMIAHEADMMALEGDREDSRALYSQVDAIRARLEEKAGE